MPARADAAAALRASAAATGLFDVGPQPGSAWHPLTSAGDPAWIGELVDRTEAGDGHGPRPRAVAGAYVAGALTWAVLQPATALLLREGRALDLSPEGLALLVDDTGWASRLAVVEPRFAALPGDPAATAAVALVPDVAALVERSADAVVATFTPIFAAVRACSPYGLAGMWGALADTVAAVLWLLHERGADPAALDRAWAGAESLVDALQRRVPQLKARSRRFRFEQPDPPVALPLRGTCCLYYRTPEAAVDGSDGLCTTCPRRSDEARVRLVEAGFAAPADPPA